MTLPSADELLTGVSKNAHGSVDGIEDSENKKIDWRAVGTSLRHYIRVRFRTAAQAACSPRGPRATVYGAGPLLPTLLRPRSYVL